MTDGADDVKDLLGRAFGEEPPLRIDRDQVVEHGRKRLRRKRFLEAGGVVAAVVVAAVGAATLTNLTGSSAPEKLPPAASSTYQAPPGPELPLTASTTPLPPTSTETTQSPPPRALVALDPATLTAKLYATGVLSATEALALPGQSGRVAFTTAGEQAVYRADVIRPHAQGFLQIVIGTTTGIGGACAATPPDSTTDCEVNHKFGTDVVVNRHVDGNGQRSTVASAVLANGLRVSATATNLTVRATNAGGKGDGSPPVLTEDELCMLITKAGFGA
ncbi:hypothetical protein [Actinophytocola sp.]|uniref:hypothetical protein n=1 Tax=Actinophytocola sp. TaxID=1872138 RepID=UPI00389B2AAF